MYIVVSCAFQVTTDCVLPSQEVRSRIAKKTYSVINQPIEMIDHDAAINMFRNICGNQQLTSNQILKCTSALHEALQDVVVRELRPIHNAVCGLRNISALADSAQANATRAQEKAVIADNIVEGLEGVTEIISQAQPILNQLNVIMSKLSELENNQRQLSKEVAKMKSDTNITKIKVGGLKPQLGQIDNRLSRIEGSAKCCCTIM